MEINLDKFKLTDQKKEALETIINSKDNVFVTGEAGSGKTYLLNVLQDIYEDKSITVAPTGVAALNAGGVTIHRALKLPVEPYKPTFVRGVSMSMLKSYPLNDEEQLILKKLDILIIDEISMVRADVMDAMNDALCWYRQNKAPFGGVRLIMFGDIYQLSPVTRDEDWGAVSKFYETPYFFSSKALNINKFIKINLSENFRQEDSKFKDILNKVRVGDKSQNLVDEINEMYIHLKPEQDYSDHIVLTSTNNEAEVINKQKLDALDGEKFLFNASLYPSNIDTKRFPLIPNLELKIGAKIMTIVNDTKHDKFVNGTIGILTGIIEDPVTGGDVLVMNDNIYIEKNTWEDVRFVYVKSENVIKREVVGKVSQFPVKLAYAITIHKSQGLTFDKVAVDLSRSFAHGQVYVALSRCRTMEGTALLERLYPRHIICDKKLSLIDKSIKQP